MPLPIFITTEYLVYILKMKKISTLNKTEQKAIEEFKELLNKKYPKDIESVKLFGSKARGDFHKESDIDLMVVLKNANENKKDNISDTAYDLLLKYEVDISPRIYSLKEFNYLNDMPTVFMQIVKKEGIELWNKQ